VIGGVAVDDLDVLIGHHTDHVRLVHAAFLIEIHLIRANAKASDAGQPWHDLHVPMVDVRDVFRERRRMKNQVERRQLERAVQALEHRLQQLGQALVLTPLAVGFQWINPKAWITAVSAFSTYAPKAGYLPVVMLIVFVFGVVSVPCVLVWTGFGVGLSRFLNRPAALRAFNFTMAGLLVASLYPLAAQWAG